MKFKSAAVITFACLFFACSSSKHNSSGLSDLAGTKWQLMYSTEKFGPRSYEIFFKKNGTLQAKHPDETRKSSYIWKQENDKVIMDFNHGYSIYTGKIIDAKTITGEATNKLGVKWTWKAVRRD